LQKNVSLVKYVHTIAEHEKKNEKNSNLNAKVVLKTLRSSRSGFKRIWSESGSFQWVTPDQL